MLFYKGFLGHGDFSQQQKSDWDTSNMIQKGTTLVYFKINDDNIFVISLHSSEIARIAALISVTYV